MPANSGNPNIGQQAKNTRFKVGNQASKGHGRPKTRFISEALKNRLENGEAELLADETVNLAKKSKHHSVRIAAINTIADRTEGKPVQAIKHSGSIDQATARRLTEIFELLREHV